MVLPVMRSLSCFQEEKLYFLATTNCASLNFSRVEILSSLAVFNLGCRRRTRSMASTDFDLHCLSSSRACCLGTSRWGLAGKPRETVDITFLLLICPCPY